MRVKVKGKIIPASFLKIEGWGNARWGERREREGQLGELVDDQNSGPEASPKGKIERESGSKRDVRGVATARGAIENSRYVRVIGSGRSQEMTQLNTFSPRGLKVSFESLRQLKPSRMKIFLEEGRMEGKKESVLPSIGEERIGEV